MEYIWLTLAHDQMQDSRMAGVNQWPTEPSQVSKKISWELTRSGDSWIGPVGLDAYAQWLQHNSDEEC
ncbi:hypothetical protein OPV22_008961 [Ensete ventricosum]|uniref:Uncharacterized protein n=1 Tax=Ensete ventricosum TaxID=4639 RepID=A0AAV8R9M4_ENSVE|nr:hypothetical protein OPV22_008961 [Ensete ventricosum]